MPTNNIYLRKKIYSDVLKINAPFLKMSIGRQINHLECFDTIIVYLYLSIDLEINGDFIYLFTGYFLEITLQAGFTLLVLIL